MDAWKKVNSSSKESPSISIHLFEQYNIYLYYDGMASIYYGYAGLLENKEAFYSVPEGTAETVQEYVARYGTVTKHGMNSSTFAKEG
jgi:hypothetical protein